MGGGRVTDIGVYGGQVYFTLGVDDSEIKTIIHYCVGLFVIESRLHPEMKSVAD